MEHFKLIPKKDLSIFLGIALYKEYDLYLFKEILNNIELINDVWVIILNNLGV